MLNVSDDVLVYGNSPEEHNTNLKQVLSQLHTKGLTLNKKKCAFSQDNLSILDTSSRRKVCCRTLTRYPH